MNLNLLRPRDAKRHPVHRSLLSALLLALGTAMVQISNAQPSENPALSRPSGPPGAPVDFLRDIEPILQSRCTMCHGLETHMSGFRLDRREYALNGGASGKPAIIPGSSAGSRLMALIEGKEPKVKMPPVGDRLSPAEIESLRAWIDQGAVWPEQGADSSVNPLEKRGKEHWAFRPLASPKPPTVKNRAWVRNSIDAFVLAKLEGRGWQPAPAAAPSVLLRRIHLDLTGLPPTLAEQAAFTTPEAADHVVDDLLSRPTYGERWARHWLDVVRYAETNGYERDAVKPHAWRYRDYVIRAFNNDKPFDRFIVEQLAGDELPASSADSLVATGYYRLGPWDDEPADPDTDRFDQLDDIVSTTSQAFLGITLGCARCHDHKFEPVTAEDYYRVLAIFNGLERPRKGRTELDLPIGTESEIETWMARERQTTPLKKYIADLQEAWRVRFLASGMSKLPDNVVQAALIDPAKRTDEQFKLVAKYAKELDAEVAAHRPDGIRQEIAATEGKIQPLLDAVPDLPRGYFLQEPKPQPPATHLLIRGKALQPGPLVSPGVPPVLSRSGISFSPPQRTSMRRTALAHWIASKENPLTARVIVNRVWQFHFGEGLVRTPSDFGLMGQKPTHPELLDWLAEWFIAEGWSLKKLHRLILSSNTYRMSKRWNAAYGTEDPENRFLWRFPYRRLEVEAIRDSMLAVSGRLNPKMYGPSTYLEVPEAALRATAIPTRSGSLSTRRKLHGARFTPSSSAR